MNREELELDLMRAAESVGETWDQIAGRLILDIPELIALWKAAAEYMRLNHQINSNFNEAMRDPVIQKAESDAKVAMVDALKALEGK